MRRSRFTGLAGALALLAGCADPEENPPLQTTHWRTTQTRDASTGSVTRISCGESRELVGFEPHERAGLAELCITRRGKALLSATLMLRGPNAFRCEDQSQCLPIEIDGGAPTDFAVTLPADGSQRVLRTELWPVVSAADSAHSVTAQAREAWAEQVGKARELVFEPMIERRGFSPLTFQMSGF